MFLCRITRSLHVKLLLPVIHLCFRDTLKKCTIISNLTSGEEFPNTPEMEKEEIKEDTEKKVIKQ